MEAWGGGWVRMARKRRAPRFTALRRQGTCTPPSASLLHTPPHSDSPPAAASYLLSSALAGLAASSTAAAAATAPVRAASSGLRCCAAHRTTAALRRRGAAAGCWRAASGWAVRQAMVLVAAASGVEDHSRYQQARWQQDRGWRAT